MKETCKFYKQDLKRCIALRKLYCENEECSFYKPKGVRENDKRRPERSS